MNKFNNIKEEIKRYYSSRATLAAIGVKTRQLKLFEPITETVKIAQKKVKYTPGEKLMDGYIAILAGAHGLVEINKRVRAEEGLQRAFGREGCAEQSVVQDTLDACTAENVGQMQTALDVIYRCHSRGYHHNYVQQWQLVDVDMTGRPCGKKAVFASKGYFAKQRNRRGRQVGYVVATLYEEIVVERLFDGKTQLVKALQPLIKAAEKTLALDAQKRQRTILRVDSGGGSVEDVNWALAQGYQFHGKDYAANRVKNLVESVQEWITDPADPDRQMGWVTAETEVYCRPIQRIAVRCRKKNGQWGLGVILSTLSSQEVLKLTEQPEACIQDPTAVLLAYVRFYDQRGGGVETEIKEDKQGLGTTKRNKKRFHAQHMLIQLEALAHNVLVWARRWLTPLCPKVARFGIKRLVRDAFHMNGLLEFDQTTHLSRIILNQTDPLASELCLGLAALLAQQQVAVILGKT
jgi:hypothetical protein